MGIMQQVAVRWQSKTFRGHIAWRARTTAGLFRLSMDIAYEQSLYI